MEENTERVHVDHSQAIATANYLTSNTQLAEGHAEAYFGMHKTIASKQSKITRAASNTLDLTALKQPGSKTSNLKN